MMLLDDGILEHDKFVRAVRLAGGDAVHLWVGLRAYCAKKLTDGKIPNDMLSEVKGPIGRARTKALTALQAVGLVHSADQRSACPECESAQAGGDAIWMHDYLQWSESRSEAQARRVSNRERQRRLRDKSHVSNGVTNTVTNATVTPSVTAPHTMPDPDQIQTKPDLPPTPLAGGAAAVTDHRITRERLPCPKDLSLLPDQLGQLETSMITREFIAEATRKFIGQELADNEKTMTLVQWRKCLYAAVCNGWSQRKPPGMLKHEQAKRDAAQAPQGPAYKLFKPIDDVGPMPIGDQLAALDLARKAVGR